MSESGFFWTGKECPDCGGELEQQDEHNVMCLTCETVFQHILSDAEHVLHHQDLGIAAEEPRMATDGGRSETEIEQTRRIGRSSAGAVPSGEDIMSMTGKNIKCGECGQTSFRIKQGVDSNKCRHCGNRIEDAWGDSNGS